MAEKNQLIYKKIEDIPLWEICEPPKPYLFKNNRDHVFPVLSLKSWKDFLCLLNSESVKNQQEDLIFRGHDNADWELECSLSRMNKNYSNKHIEHPLKKEIIDLQLSMFKKELPGDFTENQMWAIGQHHGLWTPYLDWTSSPDVALYFAIKSFTHQNNKIYFSISVLNFKKILSNRINDIEIISRKDLNLSDNELYKRIHNQDGCFTKTPNHSSIESVISTIDINWSEYFYKIYIQNSDIHLCREYLLTKDIDVKYIFPDLEGSVKRCNENISKKSVSFNGGMLIPIAQMVLDHNEIAHTKNLLLYLLENDIPDCKLEKAAQEINALRFNIERILLENKYPYEKIQSFLNAYINNN